MDENGPPKPSGSNWTAIGISLFVIGLLFKASAIGVATAGAPNFQDAFKIGFGGSTSGLTTTAIFNMALSDMGWAFEIVGMAMILLKVFASIVASRS